MKTITKLKDIPIKGRRILVRVDFNVPLKQVDDHYEVADVTRMVGALPSILYILQEGGKCILASHLGRPNGKPSKKYSLEPVGLKLSELLGLDVILTDDCVGDGARSLTQQMRPGEVILLENLRFHEGEEENSAEFSHKLLELCDAYVSDAFGTLHRAHASTAGVPRLCAEKGMDRAAGLLVEKELAALTPLKENPHRPFVLIMGGSKVSDKIGVLDHFMPKVDKIVIGGAMAYAFLSAQGQEIGKSLCDYPQVTLASRLLKSAAVRNVEIFLPVDHVTTTDIKNADAAQISDLISEDRLGVDIGPKTIKRFGGALAGAETVFWNGPMGVFETPAFANGTFEMARLIAASTAKKLAGGGDSVAAIEQAGLAEKFDFISTGGGATLEFLEGKELPGLKALEVSVRSS